MQCKCIDNSRDNGNFTLGRIYRVEENVGIWQPILCRFRDWDNPGKLFEGTIFEFAMCKFEVLWKFGHMVIFVMLAANSDKSI